MVNNRILTLILLVLVVLLTLLAFWQRKQPEQPAVSSFEDCANAGYPILESYPPQCRTPQGQSFTQNVGNELEKRDVIRIDSPRPNATVQSPLNIAGQARGTWFFEASFPIHLEDAAGNRIITIIATAEGEWMTEDFVPFTAQLAIPPTIEGQATLVLEKDNPSGLPEHADELRVPIIIAP